MNEIEQIKQATSWEERYRLIIQASKHLPRPSDEALQQMQIVQGCESQVWFDIQPMQNGRYHFNAFSEARIMNGLLWILLQAIDNQSAEQLKQFDLTHYFTQLGIAQRLSQTRLNGLQQIAKQIHQLD